MSKYILKVGNEGSERLDFINQVFAPYSQYFLTDVGLKSGMNVIEIGCGTGIMTTWIAKQVGGNGRVVAIDASIEQLKYAEINAKKQGLLNIEFVNVNAEEINFKKNSFDFAYSKLLLMHLQNPAYVLNKLYELLKSKGILSCEEPTAASLLTHPHHKIIEKMNKHFIQLGEKRGMDFNIGDKLPELFLKMSLSLIRPRFIQPIIPMEMAKEFLLLGAKEVSDAMLKENLITEQELYDMITELNTTEESAAYYAFPRQIQIAGMKN